MILWVVMIFNHRLLLSQFYSLNCIITFILTFKPEFTLNHIKQKERIWKRKCHWCFLWIECSHFSGYGFCLWLFFVVCHSLCLLISLGFFFKPSLSVFPSFHHYVIKHNINKATFPPRLPPFIHNSIILLSFLTSLCCHPPSFLTQLYFALCRPPQESWEPPINQHLRGFIFRVTPVKWEGNGETDGEGEEGREEIYRQSKKTKEWKERYRGERGDLGMNLRGKTVDVGKVKVEKHWRKRGQLKGINRGVKNELMRCRIERKSEKEGWKAMIKSAIPSFLMQETEGEICYFRRT